mmetsp:Transcript_17444/g.55763  ORF Transcript_17444/g.55763 Transcript_17444/m.55763 type:complete len:268 (+) Transcript_17444:835-1638(+)
MELVVAPHRLVPVAKAIVELHGLHGRRHRLRCRYRRRRRHGRRHRLAAGSAAESEREATAGEAFWHRGRAGGHNRSGLGPRRHRPVARRPRRPHPRRPRALRRVGLVCHAAEVHPGRVERDARRAENPAVLVPERRIDGRLAVHVASPALHRECDRERQVAARRVAGEANVLHAPDVARHLEGEAAAGERRVVDARIVRRRHVGAATAKHGLRRARVVDGEDRGSSGLHELGSDERLVDGAEEEVAAAVVVEDELLVARHHALVLDR